MARSEQLADFIPGSGSSIDLHIHTDDYKVFFSATDTVTEIEFYKFE